MGIRHHAGRCMLGIALLAGGSAATADVFINELHYDNDGTDVGERVEIVAPAGTSLAGWSVVLYDGGTGQTYSTVALSGTISDQCNGFGTAVAATPGTQNGAPDGVALVNASGVAVQLLSYEGSFTASNGPASGMASSAIGVSETSSTAAGQSLRLSGSGSTYADFSWQAASTDSFGACNAGQSFTSGSSGNTLGNGVAVNALAANTGNSLAYTIEVPSGATNLSIAISGGSGDADLYVRHASAPTTSTYDCRPYQTGNSETCSFATPQSGTWHVMVHAYSSFSSVSLVGSFSEYTPPPPSSNTLENGVARTGLGAATGSSLNYTMDVPSGATNLSIAISGGSGDADLYVRFGSAPTTTVYDCRPYLGGNGETCSFPTPQAGTWHVMLSAYTSFSNVSLLGSYTAASGGGGGSGYYASVVTTSASELRASLHQAIDDHTKIPYTASTTDSWDVLEVADQDPLDSARVLDIYRNDSYAKAGGGNTDYNREHTWPKSLGFPDDGAGNYPYTDLHMLMVSDIDHNASRGNLPFGDCSASCSEFPTGAYAGQGGGTGVFPGNSNWSNGAVWQVWTKLKGNVARAVLYMDIRYEGGTHGVTAVAEPDLRLTDDLTLVVGTGSNASVAYMGRLSTLLQWHADDPVTEAERLRNDAVYSYQGNRNPFVDHPEWVDCIYRSICN